MSDKKLLNESTIRRFMTLAGTQPLSDNFLSEQAPPEDEPAPEMDAAPADDMAMDEPPMDAEPPMDDEGGMDDEELSLTEEEARVLIDLGRRLEGVVPEEDMADDDMADDDMEPEMEDEEPMEEEYAMTDDDGDGEDGEDGDADVATEAYAMTIDDNKELEEALNEANIHILSEEEESDLVQEVFKRVTKRIIADRLK